MCVGTITMKLMRPLGSALAAIVSSATLLMATAAAAQKCDQVLAVAYVGSDQGALTIRVNDVTLLRARSSEQPNFVPADLLLEGENTLTIELTGKDGGTPTAQAEVFEGCKGEMAQAPGENDNVLASVALDGGGSDSATFPIGDLPAYSYLSAGPTEPAGLLEAVDGLIQTVQAKNLEGYLDYMSPMLHDFALEHPQAEAMLRQMGGFLISGPVEVVEPGDLSVRPVLGGRAYEVHDAVGKPPLQFTMPGEMADTPDELSQAGIWIKTDDGWKVLRH